MALFPLSLQPLSRSVRAGERIACYLGAGSNQQGFDRYSYTKLRRTCLTGNRGPLISWNASTEFDNAKGSNSSNKMLIWNRNYCSKSNGKVGGYELERTCEKCSHNYTSKITPGGDERIEFVKVVSCPKCGALQSMEGHGSIPNYFDVLGQRLSYRVDIQEMSNKARRLQKKFHPDLFSQKGEAQQSLSQEYSSLINKALSTLSDPISRGRYILAISGLSSDDPDGDLEKTMTNDPELLEEVMELNWKLEEITSENEWKEFRNQNLETMKLISLELEKAFDKDDMKESQRLLGRLKYYDTIQHKLKDLQSKIGIVE